VGPLIFPKIKLILLSFEEESLEVDELQESSQLTDQVRPNPPANKGKRQNVKRVKIQQPDDSQPREPRATRSTAPKQKAGNKRKR
jgi:hypothetical protein